MAAWLRFVSVICLVLLVSTPMTGCGTTTDENASLAGKPLKGAQARLKIFRTSELIAAVPSARVKVDGRQVAELGVGGSTMLDVPAGSRTVVVDALGHPNVYSVTLKAKAGMLYTLEVSPRTEAAVAGVLFGLVGSLVEAGINQNGGTFQVRVTDVQGIRP
ncbi:MAG: hypothetical protein ABW200_12980 [Hyphomicrobiaceae bacterium]|jgi:hypothetical protein